MCGIIGIVGHVDPARATIVSRGVAQLVHRGPDARGVQDFGQCLLGHTRLRIIDLSPAADQPMHSEDGAICVAYNGEIYNFRALRRELERQGYRFRTDTDTEVLLHLYARHGTRLVEHLEGMYAFALWDDRRRRLLLGRDRLGIKPLYYRQTGREVAFASEVRCLTRDDSVLNPDALGAYLKLGWVTGPETIFANVKELPAGHTLSWHDGTVEVRRYWSPSDVEPEPVTAEELADALRHAVDRQLVADVPVGLFLSSGVDSTVLASLAAQAGAAPRTFTVAFDIGPDEASGAGDIAGRLGLEHEVVRVSGGELTNALPRIVADMDQPTVDGVNSWVICRAVRQVGAVVALSGLGGDELFRGYSTFRHAPRIAAMSSVVGRLPRLSSSALDLLSRADRWRFARWMRAGEASIDGRLSAAYTAVRGLFPHRALTRLWPPAQDLDPLVLPVINVGVGRGGDGVQQVARLELENYLPFQLLRDTDAMSMAHSLEVRVPLLDDAVVAKVLARMSSPALAFDKTAMIRAADPTLIDVARQRKRTFTLPFARWLHGPLASLSEGAFRRLSNAGLGFDAAELQRLRHAFGRGDVGWRPIWALTVLGEWLDCNRNRLESSTHTTGLQRSTRSSQISRQYE